MAAVADAPSTFKPLTVKQASSKPAPPQETPAVASARLTYQLRIIQQQAIEMVKSMQSGKRFETPILRPKEHSLGKDDRLPVHQQPDAWSVCRPCHSLARGTASALTGGAAPSRSSAVGAEEVRGYYHAEKAKG